MRNINKIVCRRIVCLYKFVKLCSEGLNNLQTIITHIVDTTPELNSEFTESVDSTGEGSFRGM